jgi:hypothetical protein
MNSEQEAAMIPYDIDPSLHASEPQLETLEDGFSPPPADEFEPEFDEPFEPHIELALAEQSLF